MLNDIDGWRKMVEESLIFFKKVSEHIESYLFVVK